MVAPRRAPSARAQNLGAVSYADLVRVLCGGEAHPEDAARLLGFEPGWVEWSAAKRADEVPRPDPKPPTCGRPIGATASRLSAATSSDFAAPEFRRGTGGAAAEGMRRRLSERSEPAATKGPARRRGTLVAGSGRRSAIWPQKSSLVEGQTYQPKVKWRSPCTQGCRPRVTPLPTLRTEAGIVRADGRLKCGHDHTPACGHQAIRLSRCFSKRRLIASSPKD
jgi:hypothetical protein